MAIRTSDSTAALMEALATAQGKFGAAIKGNVNPAFRSKYADLSAVIDATLEHLNEAGIVVMQHPDLTWQGEVAYVTVTTRLQYKAEWMESDISIPAVQRDRFDAQSVGSAITYGCRYALQSILVVPREDDDANAASGRGSHEAAQAVAQEKIAKAKKKQDEVPSQAREVEIKLLTNMDWAVTGNLDDKAIAKYLVDIEAKGFRAKEDGRYWYKADANYLQDFKLLCDKQEIRIL